MASLSDLATAETSISIVSAATLGNSDVQYSFILTVPAFQFCGGNQSRYAIVSTPSGNAMYFTCWSKVVSG